MDSSLGALGKSQNVFRAVNLSVRDDEHISLVTSEMFDVLGPVFGEFGSAARFDGFKNPARLMEVGPRGFDHFRSEGINMVIEGNDVELIVVGQDPQSEEHTSELQTHH